MTIHCLYWCIAICVSISQCSVAWHMPTIGKTHVQCIICALVKVKVKVTDSYNCCMTQISSVQKFDCSNDIYHIYSRICPKIYNKILPAKLEGDLSLDHKIKIFFQPPKHATSNTPHWWHSRDDKFDDDGAIYNNRSEDYADLLHPVQVLKNHLGLIHWSVTLDHIWTRFLMGELYVERLYKSIW